MIRRKRRRKSLRRKESPRRGLVYALILIALLPVLYGLYLYYTQERQGGARSEAVQSVPERRAGAVEGKTVAFERPAVDGRKLEIPVSKVPLQEQLIHHKGYTVSYNKNTRLPNWVSYELTRQETKGREKRGDRFVADPAVKGATATNADYKRSGYDRGHMAPAADMKWSRTAMEESFYFSNMCPQHPQLNRRAWKELEEKIRDWAVADSAIIIICGPILDRRPKTIGPNRVAVPKRFFKVVLSPYVKPMRAIGFLFNNQMAVEPLSTYSVPVDRVEQLTGMDFFAPLPDEIENKIEAESDYRKWPH